MEPTAPERAISAVERVAGVAISIHDLVGAFVHVLHPGRLRHEHALCRAAKAAGGEARCSRFDVERVRAACAQRDALIKRCHAGLGEVVVPHREADGTVSWLLFAGPLDITVADADLADGSRTAPRGLPPAERARLADLVELLRQLDARLTAWRTGSDALPSARGAGLAEPAHLGADRRTVIATFLQRRHRDDVRLADLAEALGLSSPRTSHVVRELFARPFARLLLETRLDSAALLLAYTDLPIGTIATRCGFGDRSHFHAAFRRRFGHAPRTHRLRVRGA